MNIKLIGFLIAITCSPISCADLLLIVNNENSVNSLERKQVIDIFMGRSTVFPNQKPAHPLDISGNKGLRANFYKMLTGKSESQVDAYWATLVFAGKMSPPEKISDETSAIKAVKNNPSAIAYVTRQTLPAGVKIVMEIPTSE